MTKLEKGFIFHFSKGRGRYAERTLISHSPINALRDAGFKIKVTGNDPDIILVGEIPADKLNAPRSWYIKSPKRMTGYKVLNKGKLTKKDWWE